MIDMLCRRAAEAGKLLSLHVFTVNPARNMYERLGFDVLIETGDRVEMRLRSQG